MGLFMADPSMSVVEHAFLAKIESRQVLVGIIGLGYVGLPLAQAFTAGGFRVLGFDIDPTKVDPRSGRRVEGKNCH